MSEMNQHPSISAESHASSSSTDSSTLTDNPSTSLGVAKRPSDELAKADSEDFSSHGSCGSPSNKKLKQENKASTSPAPNHTREVESQTSPSDFRRLTSRVRLRSYRVNMEQDANSPESSTEDQQNDEETVGTNEEPAEDSEYIDDMHSSDDSDSDSQLVDASQPWYGLISRDGPEDGEDGAEEEEEDETGPLFDRKTRPSQDEDRSEEEPEVLSKKSPISRWFPLKGLEKRSLGLNTSIIQFPFEFYGSLGAVQRLDLLHKMEYHSGCVNTLHFNFAGDKLASSSDDLNVAVWDWTRASIMFTYETGHRGNVFQAKFLPFQGDTHIVTCARDGHVRLAEVSSDGVRYPPRRLGLHKGPAHKLTLLPDTPHIVLTAGEDAVVLEIDVRESKPNKILTVKQEEKKVALYSIHGHPLDGNIFCLGGKDQYLRVYDRRNLRNTQAPLKSYAPQHMLDSRHYNHITAAVYNYDGSEILATYNDEDIYLFDAKRSDVSEHLHRYQGHRNNATVKGVNFFGPRSEFVVSGSDCGNIFFWEKQSEAIVQFMAGDENGVVNCLEPHPLFPVLATSGLDDDVKVWMPYHAEGAEPMSISNLKKTVTENLREREEEKRRDPSTLDGELLWMLWRHMRRNERRRRQQGGQAQRASGEGNADSSSEDESETSDTEERTQTVQCAPS